MSTFDPVRIGLVSTSDRASSGVYADQGIPALQQWLGQALRNPIHWETRLIPDEQAQISATLCELAQRMQVEMPITNAVAGVLVQPACQRLVVGQQRVASAFGFVQ